MGPADVLDLGHATMRYTWLLIVPLLLAGRSSPRAGARSSRDARSGYTGWAAYGGGPEQIRYSSLQQINTANVRQLTVAWTYDSGESGGLQTQPIVAGGVLYAYTPTHKTFAVRAGTGEHLWTFDPGIVGRGANRGVMYWTGGATRASTPPSTSICTGSTRGPASRSRRSATTGGSICASTSTAIPRARTSG